MLHVIDGQLEPGGVGEVSCGEVDPVALDPPVGVDRRQPGDGDRGVRHVQNSDVTRRLRN